MKEQQAPSCYRAITGRSHSEISSSLPHSRRLNERGFRRGEPLEISSPQASHQVNKVIVIETLLCSLRNGSQILFESFDGISAAFDMRIIRREQTNLFTCLFDH